MLAFHRLALVFSVITLSIAPIAATAAEPLKVVASFTVIADFARNVGGDRISLTTLVGPDGDAHVYEPKPADAAAMAAADVVLVNGLHFEGFLQRLVDASATHATVAELTRGVEPIRMKPEFAEAEDDDHAQEGHAHQGRDQGDIDPHAFQSIANARIYVENIADAFCAADAEGCTAYRANAEAYEAKLAALEGEVKAAIAAIPQEKRTVITSHDAFGYFEHAYGLIFLAPQGISTEAEPSAADVARLIDQIRQDKASAIFVENISNPRLLQQIATESGIRIGGTLYSDALSGPAGPASTYIDMMHNNVAELTKAIMAN